MPKYMSRYTPSGTPPAQSCLLTQNNPSYFPVQLLVHLHHSPSYNHRVSPSDALCTPVQPSPSYASLYSPSYDHLYSPRYAPVQSVVQLLIWISPSPCCCAPCDPSPPPTAARPRHYNTENLASRVVEWSSGH
ncbi:hypothetical protein E2C01_017171 [Portunus trituberculatus]|uniref:Uncharacterized protein n=1 Tax=Portunus trituberculatus TaxID=210409 RepID=A0A5B7DRL7_PORTR|nr:hypothetical protein [Portunus trituberculatus]